MSQRLSEISLSRGKEQAAMTREATTQKGCRVGVKYTDGSNHLFQKTGD